MRRDGRFHALYKSKITTDANTCGTAWHSTRCLSHALDDRYHVPGSELLDMSEASTPCHNEFTQRLHLRQLYTRLCDMAKQILNFAAPTNGSS
jgi:hypothetical protein